MLMAKRSDADEGALPQPAGLQWLMAVRRQILYTGTATDPTHSMCTRTTPLHGHTT